MNRPLAPVMLKIVILVGLLALLLVLPTFAQAPPSADTFVSSGTKNSYRTQLAQIDPGRAKGHNHPPASGAENENRRSCKPSRPQNLQCSA
jgi:hypothetical protein